MTTYTMGSDRSIYAPGVLRFAIAHAKFNENRKTMIDMIVDGWLGVPREAAERLIDGKLPYVVDLESEKVVFEFDK